MIVFTFPYFLTSITFFLSHPILLSLFFSLSMFLSLSLYMFICLLLPPPPSLSLSLLIVLTNFLQMDKLDPTDELDEIGLNALRQIGSKATTVQHWLT